jgi:hypothetical protein
VLTPRTIWLEGDTMFAIRNDRPLPKSAGGRGNRVYPLPEMEVGSSFFVPLEGRKPSQVQGPIIRAAKGLAPRVFTTRRLTEDGVDGVGCWRTA